MVWYMKHPRQSRDAASKLLFIDEVIADLLRLKLPALAAELDLGRLERLPTEFVRLDRSRRIGDSACRIPFARGTGGGTPRRYALVSSEFQDRNDGGMLARVREYTVRLLEDGRHQGSILPGEEPLLVSFVIHTGRGRWRARDGTEPAAGLPERAALEVASCQRQAYIAVDIGGSVPLPDGAPDNRFLAAARLVRARTATDLLRQLAAESRRFAGDEHRRLRAGMHAWAQEALLTEGLELPPFEELENARESDMTQLYEDRGQRWIAEWLAEGREEGREEGVVAGRRDLLVELAEQRFGTAASRRLAEVLNDHPTARQLSATSDLLLACDTPDDFLKRLPD